jgi:hypothetical protein
MLFIVFVTMIKKYLNFSEFKRNLGINFDRYRWI